MAGRSDLEMEDYGSIHIGKIKSYTKTSRTGIIRLENKDYVFLYTDVTDPYFRQFLTKNTYVVFWSKNGLALQISPLFWERYSNIKNKIFCGRITNNGKQVKFNLFGADHRMNLQFKHRHWSPGTNVNFQLQVFKGLPYVSRLIPV